MIAPLVSLDKVRTSRSGVIPYVLVNDQIYFLFGKDIKTKELTDFGGGVKTTENAISGAIREFKEETNMIFDAGTYELKTPKKIVALSNYIDMTILFIEVEMKWFNRAPKKFFFKKGANKEIDSILWIHENKFKKLLSYNPSGEMWEKVRGFLSKHIDESFYKVLRERND